MRRGRGPGAGAAQDRSSLRPVGPGLVRPGAGGAGMPGQQGARGGLGKDGVYEGGGVEGGQVVGAFAQADQLDRDA
jgi:hypothetical protein